MARIRGADCCGEGLFGYVSCEARVPAGHPLPAGEVAGILALDLEAAGAVGDVVEIDE